MATTSAAPVPVIMVAAEDKEAYRIVSLGTRRRQAARPSAARATPTTASETPGVVRNLLDIANEGDGCRFAIRLPIARNTA